MTDKIAKTAACCYENALDESEHELDCDQHPRNIEKREAK